MSKFKSRASHSAGTLSFKRREILIKMMTLLFKQAEFRLRNQTSELYASFSWLNSGH